MPLPTELVVTWQARQDLQEIYQYTLETWDQDQADSFEDHLYRVFDRLRRFPELGRLTSDPGSPPVRVLHDRHHAIVYRFSDQQLTVLRVVNPRQRLNLPR